MFIRSCDFFIYNHACKYPLFVVIVILEQYFLFYIKIPKKINTFKKTVRRKMPHLYSIYDLYDIYGQILVKANQKITRTLGKPSIIIDPKNFQNEIPLSETSIAKDLKEIVSSGIYAVIFSDRADLDHVIEIAEKTKFVPEIIEELKRIKQNLPITYHHILAVSALSIKISLDLNYNPFEIAKIGFAHDLGKSRLPKEILEKDGPLSHYEFSIIQTHPLAEYILLSHYLKNPKSFIAYASFSHHERCDGSGYPRGIRRLNKYIQSLIPCDIFDALVSPRPYRSSPYTARAALDLLLDEARIGKIDRKYVLCLISYMRKCKPNLGNVVISDEKRDPPPLINYYGIRVE